MKTKTAELIEKAESFRKVLNYWLGQGDIKILDELFPNHDGVADPNVAAELYELRDLLYSIRGGIDMAMPKLCGDIELLKKADEQ